MNGRDIDNVTGSEEFAKRLTGVLNDGALCLMLSIGHQTGLFDTMASLPASSGIDFTLEQLEKARKLTAGDGAD